MVRLVRLALCATAALITPAAAQTIGVSAAVINDVRMTTDANPTLHRAIVRERVSLDREIVTGRASRMQVVLLDRTSFTVGANARLRVDRFIYDPDRQSSAVSVTVRSGAFRLMSGKATHRRPGESQLRTPIATIGIRGTIVEGAVGMEALSVMAEQRNVAGYDADPETASLIVLRGPATGVPGEEPGWVDVTSGGRSVVLDKPGMAAFVPAEGRPPIVFALWNCGLLMLVDLLRNPGYRMQQSRDPLTRGLEPPVRQLPVTQFQLAPRV